MGANVIKRVRRFAAVSHSRVLWCALALVIAPCASAQEATSADAPDQQRVPPMQPPAPAGRLTLRAPSGELSGSWTPLGPAPVDQAGSGRRGYVIAGESSDVVAAGSNQWSIHTVAANDFYNEQNTEFLITKRYEAHTFALEYRRGFKLQKFPRFELGAQVQLHESDSGMLNGFILGLESFWTSVTGYRQSTNELRGSGATPPPLGTRIVRNGATIYREDGGGSGIGDFYAVAKMAVVDADPSSKVPRVSARLAMNVAGSSPFTEGNFVGAGLSLDHKWTEWVAFHGDLRAARALDQTSVWSLPLRRWTYAFSAGPEFRLPKNSSLNLQIDGSSTPYWPTGTLAFDKGYGAITFGLGHRFARHVTAQLYLRENMNLPFKVRWNTDPDLSVGLKVRIY